MECKKKDDSFHAVHAMFYFVFFTNTFYLINLITFSPVSCF